MRCSLNRKEDVVEIVATVGQQLGVAGVRIYDKRGRIIVSSDPAEAGRQVDMQAEACIICHDRRNLCARYRCPRGSASTSNRTENASSASSSDRERTGVHELPRASTGPDDPRRARRQDVARHRRRAARRGREAHDRRHAACGPASRAVSAAFIYFMVRLPVQRLIAARSGSARVTSPPASTSRRTMRWASWPPPSTA